MFNKELEIFEEETQEDIVELPEKERRRLRRRNNIRKALRKRNIAQKLYGEQGFYSSLHAYSKNKIHCSCPMCRPQGLSHSDAKKLASANEQLGDD